MDQNEALLLEGIKGLFNSQTLGLKQLHGTPESHEHSHFAQFGWAGIEDVFNTKIIGSPFHEAIRSAFHVIHSYKYLDNPSFGMSFISEMQARAVPQVEQQKAIKALQETIKETLKDVGDEQSMGWNPQLDEIIDMVQNLSREPQKTEPFTGGIL